MITGSFIIQNIISQVGSIIVISGNTAILRMIFQIISYTASSQTFIILDYTFLGMTYIIVYSGALAIIFIFIVMLLPTRGVVKTSVKISSRIYMGLIQLAILAVLISGIVENKYIQKYGTASYMGNYIGNTDIYYYGISLYLLYPLSVYIISILLWAVMIGVLDILS